MPHALEEELKRRLQSRTERRLLRKLTLPQSGDVDFSSNDYLGLSTFPKLSDLTAKYLREFDEAGAHGSTGSRLLTGNSRLHEYVERVACSLHASESATLFNSGYDANLGLLGCVASSGDAIVYDDQCHASTREGVATSRARVVRSFAHNDLDALRALLAELLPSIDGSAIVVVESLYSMDGDLVPLKRLLTLCERAGGARVSVIVDEAHAGGVLGSCGGGYICERALEDHPRLFARVVTLGKAFGVQGAFVLGSLVLREALLNYARPLVFSTSLPKPSVAAIAAAYELVAGDVHIRARRATLHILAEYLRSRLVDAGLSSGAARRHIQTVVLRDADRCVRVSSSLKRRGFRALAIRSPTVPLGEERIRITLNAAHTRKHVDGLVDALIDAVHASAPHPHAPPPPPHDSAEKQQRTAKL